MAAYQHITELIGKTPLLHFPIQGTQCQVYLKLEMFNLGHSVKDRAAMNMLLRAEQEGHLKPGGMIIESSSGNTGISLAMLAAARGYHFICVVDNHVSPEKLEILKAYGAQIESVGADLPPDYHAAKERVERVKLLCEAMPTAFFIDQGDNLYNGEAHYKTTAEEILADIGTVDYLIASVGTGGSISGTGRRLKEGHPHTVLIAVEPAGSVIFGQPYQPFFQSGSGSARLIFKNVDFSLIDENDQITDRHAFNTCTYMAQRKGLLMGGSGGSALYKAVEYVTTRGCQGNMVVIIPDSGERYMTTIFNQQWMVEHSLYDPTVWDYLDQYL